MKTIFKLLSIVFLASCVLFGYLYMQCNKKLEIMKEDMRVIANACVVYENLNVSKQPPVSISKLIEGLSAEDSVDKGDHHKLLISRDVMDKKLPTINDPWGRPHDTGLGYRLVYKNGVRYVNCVPVNMLGQLSEPYIVYF